MDAVARATTLNLILYEWQNSGDNPSAAKLDQLSGSAKHICTSLQTSVNQVAAFRKSYPDARYSDYGEAYHFLIRLLGEAKPLAADIQEEINTQSQKINYEVSLMAVKESKSAIARKFPSVESGFFPL
jgi:hypothetical protein